MLLQRVREYFFEKGFSENENGKFIIDISGDTVETWEDILSDENDKYPFYALKQAMDDAVQKYPEKVVRDIAEKLFAETEDANEKLSEIEAIVRDLIIITYSMDELLRQEVNVDIGIDTGDGGWDYYANTVYPGYDSYYSLEEVKNESSMVWLVKQQGHKISELRYALNNIVKHSELIKNKFMHSVAYEVWHEMCGENQLFCLVKMTVEDLLILNSLMRWQKETQKWAGYIVINTDATVGFYSHWVGSTSLLGIKLEKELKLPMNIISCITPDSAFDEGDSYYGYSVYSVMNNSALWDNGCIVYKSLPKHFRLNMEKMGLRPIRKNERTEQTVD